MSNTGCIKIHWGATGRVSYAAQSTYARDWPGVEGAVRPSKCDGVMKCADCARQSSRPNEDARLRMEYAYSSGVHAGADRLLCTYCLLPGSFALDKSDPARLEVCHLRAVARFGSSSPKVLAPGHKECNAQAGDRDLLHLFGEQRDWPTLKAAQAWAGTPHRTRIPNSLPTVEAMAEGRARRPFANGTIGCGF